MGVPRHASVKAVQLRMVSQGISITQDTAVSWQDHGEFWDSEGVIHVDFLPHNVTINIQYYINLLHNDVHQAI